LPGEQPPTSSRNEPGSSFNFPSSSKNDIISGVIVNCRDFQSLEKFAPNWTSTHRFRAVFSLGAAADANKALPQKVR
jgi:hypothetical protein